MNDGESLPGQTKGGEQELEHRRQGKEVTSIDSADSADSVKKDEEAGTVTDISKSKRKHSKGKGKSSEKEGEKDKAYADTKHILATHAKATLQCEQRNRRIEPV